MAGHSILRDSLARVLTGTMAAICALSLAGCAALFERERPHTAKTRPVAAKGKPAKSTARASRPVPKIVAKAPPARPAPLAPVKSAPPPPPSAPKAAAPAPQPVTPAAKIVVPVPDKMAPPAPPSPAAVPRSAIPLPPAPQAAPAIPAPAPVAVPVAPPPPKAPAVAPSPAPSPAPAAAPPPPPPVVAQPPAPAAVPPPRDVAPGVVVQDPPSDKAGTPKPAIPPPASAPPAPPPAGTKSGSAPAPKGGAKAAAPLPGNLNLPSAGSAGAIIIGPGIGGADPTGSGASQKWSVVPLLYGTDRKRRDLAARIAYGSERGRRLEIGQALVTVPKSHTVPNIERPWTLNVPYLNVSVYQQSEDPARHFTLSKIGTLDRKAFLDFARQRLAAATRFKTQAVVFVHGYNTGFDTAIYRGAQLAYDLRFDGPAFVYSWPSGGGFTSYTYDRESAEQAVPYLRQFLEVVLAESGAAGVNIIAHSMGNKPLLEALADIRGSKRLTSRINQIILAAPDVDRDGFENIAAQIRGLGRGITLYASANDRAMSASRRFHGGIPRAGDVPTTGPVIVQGIDTIDVTATSTEIFALNHSGYAQNTAMLNDIELLLHTGERPPERRVPILERVTTAIGVYWRYPAR